jgi:8-oxo-dGTP diphosphatase
MTQVTIRTACLAHFKDGKLLCVKPHGKDVFHFVGGRYEEGESDLDCLVREVREEIGCELDPNTITHLQDFTDVAHGRENTLVLIRLYKATLQGEPSASSEIREIHYIDTSVDSSELTDVAKNKVFPWLKENGYIK